MHKETVMHQYYSLMYRITYLLMFRKKINITKQQNLKEEVERDSSLRAELPTRPMFCTSVDSLSGFQCPMKCKLG